MTRLLYESHSHTPLCKHARGEPGDYAAAAEARGLKGIILTCHCPLPDGMSPSIRMDDSEYELYHDLIQQAREAYAGRVDVRAGLECDFLPGLEPWLESLLARKPLHHVLGSIHPQTPEYRERFAHGTWPEQQIRYFDLLAQAAESRLFDTLAHPDLIKNESPDEWMPERIFGEILKRLDRIAATGTAMELNTSGVNKALSEVNPGPLLLREIARRNIPMVLGADAHRPERVADGFAAAIGLLEAGGFAEVHFYLDRKRQAVSLADARRSLAAPAAA
jgi:histidinol-phosphatase (PHP family)